VRLDSAEAVQSFRCLARFFYDMSSDVNAFHMAAFEANAVIVAATIAVIFGSSLFDIEVATWNIFLFAVTGLLIPTIAVVFLNVSATLGTMTTSLIERLDQQKRLNLTIIDHCRRLNKNNDRSRAEEELESANTSIAALVEELTDTKPVKVFGVFKLTKENITKGVAALAVSLFTTAVRYGLNT
jgi:hypothetical protein